MFVPSISPWVSGLVIPLTWSSLFLGRNFLLGVALFSLLWILALVFCGCPPLFLGGPAVVVIVMTFLLWKKDGEFHTQLSEFQAREKTLQNQILPLTVRKDRLQLAIRIQEESIQRISDLYDLSKRFLATLDLEQALQITEDILRKEFPFIEETKRQSYLQTVRSLVDQGMVSITALQEPLLSENSGSDFRERWGIVSGQCALGFQRISLYRQVEESAIHDGLTALLVRRYLLERLQEEVSRASRRGGHLVFLMIDLDSFKQINDTYGHLVGDVILREVAALIRRSVREMDLVGRYGGEEFAVVLPEADRGLGIQIADRIRQTIGSTSISAYDEKIHVTVSIGVAHYPEDAVASEQLIEQADRAMYEAKRMGRNRTVSASA